MKKILIALTIVISCLGISVVSADTWEYNYSFKDESTFSNYSEFMFFLEEDKVIILELYNLIFEKYESYKEQYPYYIISINKTESGIYLYLYSYARLIYFQYHGLFYADNDNGVDYASEQGNVQSFVAYYDYNLYTIDFDSDKSPSNDAFYSDSGYYYDNFMFDSNFDLEVKGDHNYLIHNFRDTNSDYLINSGDYFPIMYKSGNIYDSSYTEINLNDYAYIALSLKNYNQEAFSTQVYVKGNYCLTPVYNYGMTERKDILTGSQVDRCSPYYDSYTPVRTSILKNDLKNHAIYYVKSYDTSKDNYIKVDTSVFDITYITEENKENPYVTIGGKTYPTIPYDNLTDTSTKSEDEGYVSGAVEEFSFTDIFTAPLEFLKDIWGSIVSVFDLVKEFFSLLPEPIPTFLLTSFLLGLSIGLLKLLF